MHRIQDTRHALGSEALITLVTPDRAVAQELLDGVWAQVEEFEARLSRFRAASELSRINHQPGQAVEVAPATIAIIRRAIELATLTGGLYNPLVLPALQAAGYAGSWPKPDAPADAALVYTNRQIGDPADIVVSDTAVAIPAGTALDLGGIGKGYLLDRLADRLAPSLAPQGQLQGFWISLGGDIICAGFDADGAPWRLGLADARTPGAIAAWATARGGSRLAVATSGVTKRRGQRADGRPWHHLIDPRTGQPAATDLLTVSIAAESGTIADIMAKCAVILGATAGRDFLAEHRIDSYLLQPATGPSERVITSHGRFIA